MLGEMSGSTSLLETSFDALYTISFSCSALQLVWICVSLSGSRKNHRRYVQNGLEGVETEADIAAECNVADFAANLAGHAGCIANCLLCRRKVANWIHENEKQRNHGT